MDQANAVRGEIDLVLDGLGFVLRPSFGAIVAIEKQSGHSLLHLAMAADSSAIDLNTAAIIVAEMVRAWGRQALVDDHTPAMERATITAAKGANKDAIGEMVYSAGLATVMPRIALALGLAASGGCLPSGEMKATGETTTETPAAD